MDKKIRVFIVDDHEFVLTAAKILLEQQSIEVVGTETSYAGALEHAFDNQPDVLMIDLNLAGENGLDLIPELLEKNLETRILVFSARTAFSAIAAAYKAGACGYLTKDHDTAEIPKAIKTIYSGNKYYMDGYAEKILQFKMHEEDNADPRTVLSPKEFEIFQRLAKGGTNEEIAHDLGMTVKSLTVRASEIYKKLGGNSNKFAEIANKNAVVFMPE